MKVMICGGSGFVGRALMRYLVDQNHEVIVVSRQPRADSHESLHGKVTYVTWEQLEEVHNFEGMKAIVNLAGESLQQRWTAEAKERMIKSRLDAVGQVKKLIDHLENKPEVLINASAVGIYGSSQDETFNEASSTPSDDFLADVGRQWEQAVDEIKGVRKIKLRIGLVLGIEGGAFPLMLLPYRFFVGGRIGSGKQWCSWIHLKDIVRLIDYGIQDSTLSGPLNACTPFPITNETLGRSIGRLYHRPHWLAVPAFVLKGLLGEMSVLLLEGQRVMPAKAEAHGFEFDYPTIDLALSAFKDVNLCDTK